MALKDRLYIRKERFTIHKIEQLLGEDIVNGKKYIFKIMKLKIPSEFYLIQLIEELTFTLIGETTILPCNLITEEKIINSLARVKKISRSLIEKYQLLKSKSGLKVELERHLELKKDINEKIKEIKLKLEKVKKMEYKIRRK